MATDIEAEIVAHLNQVLEDEDAAVTPGTSLIAERRLDSLGILDLIEYLEERYGVRFGEDEMLSENFENVSVIAALLKEKMSGGA